MKGKKVLLFVFNGFADWEPAFALPQILQSGKFQIETIGLTKKPVRSMGGLTLLPDRDLDELHSDEIGLFILPGGKAWEEKKLMAIVPVVQQLRNEGIPIAAICAATTLLSDAGLLDQIRHTSNGKSYIRQQSPFYKGENHYSDEPAITDSNIITAGGTGAIEFAREIFRLLKIYDEKHLNQWYELFKHGIWLE